MLEHQHHDFGYIKDIASRYKTEFLSEMTSADSLVEHSEIRYKDLPSQIAINHERLRLKTETAFHELEKALLEAKKSILMKIEEKMELQKAKGEEWYKSLQHLKSTTEQGKIMCQNVTDVEFFLRRTELSEQLKVNVEQTEHLKMEPADADVHVMDCKSLRDACVSSTFLFMHSNPARFTADIRNLDTAEVKKQIIIPVSPLSYETLQVEEGDMTCSLALTRNKEAVGVASLRRIQQGSYQVTLIPQQRGRQELSIKVKGRHIRGSPYHFIVKMPVGKLSEPVKEIDCSVPHGLTCFGDAVLMLEEGKRRVAIIKNHKIDRFISLDHISCSSTLAEIAADSSGNMYVTTGRTCGLLKLNSEGELLKSIVAHGNGDRQFTYPNGIAINNEDIIYMIDGDKNCRIVVLDTNLEVLKVLDNSDQRRLPFHKPRDVAFDESLIYIVDKGWIQVIDSDGGHVHTIGVDILSDPICIKIAANFLYVTDFASDCVRVFSTGGEHIQDIGESFLFRPIGLTVDDDGFLYVTTYRNKLYIL